MLTDSLLLYNTVKTLNLQDNPAHPSPPPLKKQGGNRIKKNKLPISYKRNIIRAAD